MTCLQFTCTAFDNEIKSVTSDKMYIAINPNYKIKQKSCKLSIVNKLKTFGFI